jgi:hypothetical protein
MGHNPRLMPGQSMRVFRSLTDRTGCGSTSNERVFGRPASLLRIRRPLVRGDLLVPFEHAIDLLPGEGPQWSCRMRSLAARIARVRSGLRPVRIDHDEIESSALRRKPGYRSIRLDGTEELKVTLVPAQRKELLRLTAGSVDDGKSTLIGRLLYDHWHL